MPRKKKEPEVENVALFEHISEDVRHFALSLTFFALTIFFMLSPFGKAGMVGDKTYDGLEFLLGVGYYILPLLMIILGISFLRESRPNVAKTTSIASVLFLISTLGLVALLGSDEAGGFLGTLIKKPFVALFDTVISFIFLLLFTIISLLVIFNAVPPKNALMFWKREKAEGEMVLTEEEEELIDEGIEEEEDTEDDVEEEAPEEEQEPAPRKEKNSLKDMFGLGKNPAQAAIDAHVGSVPFSPPPLKLLANDKGKPEYGDIKANVNVIKRTLQNFQIPVEMDEVSVGPTVTRYSLKPAEGVRLSRIMNLQSELALALAAQSVRVEAPIPGTSLVGIEIPNAVKTTVGLGTLLKESEYQESPKPLLVSLGRSIAGPRFADLAKMPHLLIAGTTGSGKSVTVHTLITSLLFRNSPENLRFLMVDPKRVELTLYKDIPHQLTPVITDPKKAIRALKWAVKEMERRYNVLEEEHVQNIQSYHKNIYTPAMTEYDRRKAKREKEEYNEDKEAEELNNLPERMPYIVVIIDELADIMSTYPKELEACIVRLAQMSRAVGIHLILSTQRPSVNVITGLIKANIPTRVALQVSSQIDSRTILDTNGAEKLLGAGDMLYQSGEMSKPVRIQSAFISEDEIKAVVKFLKKSYEDQLPDEIDLTQKENNANVIFSASMDDDDEDGGDDDDLYEDARDLVINTQKASTSYLQRKLSIGYSRAARIVDMLEERGVVGPLNGSKSREVYEKPGDETDDYDEPDVEEDDYEEEEDRDRS